MARGHRQEVLHHPAAPERTPVLRQELATDRPDRVVATTRPGAALLRGPGVEEVAMVEAVARRHRQEVLHHLAAPERTPVLRQELATDRPDRVVATTRPEAALLPGQGVEELAMVAVGS